MRQRRSITIHQDPGLVEAYLSDPTNLPDWLDAVHEIDPLDEDEKGLRFRHHVHDGDETTGFDGRLHANREDGTIRYTFQGETGTITTTFQLDPVPQGTRVEQELDVPLTTWSTRILAPFLWWANRSRLDDQLAALKDALEHAP